MNLVEPTSNEVAELRPDPLTFEQELDIRLEIATGIEAALGFRAGRKYWRNAGGRLYAIELGDFGRGRPLMAVIYGFWEMFEPRPVDDRMSDHDLEKLMYGWWMSSRSSSELTLSK